MHYSSEEFCRDWRFDIAQDFVTPSGESFPYAEGGHQRWGDEVHKIALEPTDQLQGCAVSHDGKYIAFSRGWDIHVHNAATFEHFVTLRGHTSDVDSLAFRPGKSNQLASCSENRRTSRPRTDPVIYLWSLDTYRDTPLTMPGSHAQISHVAVDAVLGYMKISPDYKVPITPEEEAALAKQFELPIKDLLLKKATSGRETVHGSLFVPPGNRSFSPSGNLMFYKPIPKDTSSSRNHDLLLYSPESHRNELVLSGHTDNILWAGFNKDETLIGTVAWDKSIRIWNAIEGSLEFKFETNGQNWVGEFSEDGRYFAGTCGDGTLHVYNLKTGTTHMTFKHDNGWCRSLSWHPSGDLLALGAQGGNVYLVNTVKKEAVQRRELSLEKSKIPQAARRFCAFLEVYGLRFVDQGRKLMLFTAHDGSAEIYDLQKNCKWRFARAGTENDLDHDEDPPTEGGYQVEVWEDDSNVMIATLDGDGIRLWKVPLSK